MKIFFEQSSMSVEVANSLFTPTALITGHYMVISIGYIMGARVFIVGQIGHPSP